MSNDLRGSGLMRARCYRTAVTTAVLTIFALLFAGSALAVTITSFTPANALADNPGICPAGLVTITGTGFATDGPAASVVVSFNGTPSTQFQIGSDTTIYARVPAKATDGPISVTTAAGTARSAASFSVIPCYSTPAHVNVASTKATISGFTPAKAKAGAKVTITGTGFKGATAVRIGGAKAAFKVVSAAKLTATVPAAAKSGKISVTTPAGTSRSATAFVKL
jgi:hypothetical protein